MDVRWFRRVGFTWLVLPVVFVVAVVAVGCGGGERVREPARVDVDELAALNAPVAFEAALAVADLVADRLDGPSTRLPDVPGGLLDDVRERFAVSVVRTSSDMQVSAGDARGRAVFCVELVDAAPFVSVTGCDGVPADPPSPPSLTAGGPPPPSLAAGVGDGEVSASRFAAELADRFTVAVLTADDDVPVSAVLADALGSTSSHFASSGLVLPEVRGGDGRFVQVTETSGVRLCLVVVDDPPVLVGADCESREATTTTSSTSTTTTTVPESTTSTLPLDSADVVDGVSDADGGDRTDDGFVDGLPLDG